MKSKCSSNKAIPVPGSFTLEYQGFCNGIMNAIRGVGGMIIEELESNVLYIDSTAL